MYSSGDEAEEDVDEGRIHGDDIGASGRDDGMAGFGFGFGCGSLVLVRACGVIRDIRDDRWDWRKRGVRIRFGREERVDAARAGTKKEVHCEGRWRAVGLRAATHVENQGDERFQVENSLDWRGSFGESTLHVR